MQLSREVPLASILSGSAAKLLIHLLTQPDGPRTNAALMRGSNVRDRKTYYAARGQLEALGLWENPYRIIPQVGGIIPQGGENYPPPGENYPPPPSVIDRLLDADNLPDGGSPYSPTSPFRIRRAQQITLLSGAYRETFGEELNPATAVDLLQLAADRAAPVWGALTKARERGATYPLGYAKKVLQSTPAKPAEEQERGEESYMAPSPAYTAKVEKLRALGLLDEENDE